MFARRSIAVVLSAGALAAPPAADAASISVRQDGAAAPVPAAALTTRDPNPEVVVEFAAEASYSLAVLGPDDEPAGTAVACADAGAPASRRVSYVGNGAYKVVLRTYGIVNCVGSGSEQRATFSIDARDAVAAPAAAVLLRAPYSYAYVEHKLGLDLAPGATSHDVVYARNAKLGPDGGITSDAEPAAVVGDRAEMIFFEPGIYTIQARPTGIGVNGTAVPAPWSRPLRLAVLAPFDLEHTQYLDSRGPRYVVRLTVRERSANGRVAVMAARGARGRRFRSLGRATLRGGVLVKRFSLRRRGAYRLRFSFTGSDTVAPGTITLPITIR